MPLRGSFISAVGMCELRTGAAPEFFSQSMTSWKDIAPQMLGAVTKKELRFVRMRVFRQ